MKKISSLILGSVFALNAFGANISVNGSTDPENPIMLSSYTFAATDDLLWKGINKDSQLTDPFFDGYLMVDEGQTFTAGKLFVSGTYGKSSNVNVIFGDGATLNLTGGKSLSRNQLEYYMDMRFTVVEGGSATLNVGGLDFTGDNTLGNVSPNNGESVDIYFGKGLNVVSAGSLSVASGEGMGTFGVGGTMTVNGNASFNKAIVNIEDTGSITVTGKSHLSGNIVVDGTYTSKGYVTTNTEDVSTLVVNGSFISEQYFSGADAKAIQVTVNDGGLFSIAQKYAIYNGSSFTMNGESTGSVLEFAISSGATATIGSGATLDVTGGAGITVSSGKEATDGSIIEGGKMVIAGDVNVAKSVTVSADKTAFNGSSLVIEEGGSLTVGGSSTRGLAVYEGGSLAVNGALTVKKGEMLIDTTESGVTSAKPTFTIGSKAVLNLNSFRSRGSGVVFTSGSKTTIDAREYLLDGRGALILAGGESVIENGASVNILASSGKVSAMLYHRLIVNGALHVDGGKFFILSGGTTGVIINSTDVSFKNTHISFGSPTSSDVTNGKLYANVSLDFSENAFLMGVVSGNGTHSLILAENVVVQSAGLGFVDRVDNNKFAIDLSSGSKFIMENLICDLTIADLTYSFDASKDTILINNFAENSIAIKNYNSVIDDAVLENIVVDGVDQLYWVKGESGYYWLSALAPAVPEPAEWAMILGSLALGLAIYRRRN